MFRRGGEPQRSFAVGVMKSGVMISYVPCGLQLLVRPFYRRWHLCRQRPCGSGSFKVVSLESSRDILQQQQQLLLEGSNVGGGISVLAHERKLDCNVFEGRPSTKNELCKNFLLYSISIPTGHSKLEKCCNLQFNPELPHNHVHL